MLNFGAVSLGVLELIKCKALRVRTTGVYSDNNAAVCIYDTPPHFYQLQADIYMTALLTPKELYFCAVI